MFDWYDYFEVAGTALAILAIVYPLLSSSKNGEWHYHHPLFRSYRDMTGAPLTGFTIMRRWHNGAWQYRDLTDEEWTERPG